MEEERSKCAGGLRPVMRKECVVGAVRSVQRRRPQFSVNTCDFKRKHVPQAEEGDAFDGTVLCVSLVEMNLNCRGEALTSLMRCSSMSDVSVRVL